MEKLYKIFVGNKKLILIIKSILLYFVLLLIGTVYSKTVLITVTGNLLGTKSPLLYEH